MNFLNYDSPFMTEFRKLWDYIWLGLLWILASIPLFTFGAATTAMLYTGEKRVRTDEGKIWSTFWKTFRKEFKQATLLWLVSAALTVIMAGNCLILIRVELHSIVFALLLAAVLFSLGWMQLWYGYLSRFEDTNRVLLGNTFRIALGNLPWTVLLIVIALAAVVATVYFFFSAPPVLFLIPGIYGMLVSWVFRKLFKKYLPEEANPDAQPAESETVETV